MFAGLEKLLSWAFLLQEFSGFAFEVVMTTAAAGNESTKSDTSHVLGIVLDSGQDSEHGKSLSLRSVGPERENRL